MTKNKKKNTIFKVCTLFVMALLCIISFVVPTKAYYQDENGNLKSSNLIDESILTFNQNTVSGSYSQYRSFTGFNIYLSNGTYTLSSNAFNDNFYVAVVGNETQSDYSNNVSYDSEYHSLPFTFTLPNNLYCGLYFKKVINGYDQTFIAGDLSQYYYMLNSGSSVLNYEPYGTFYSQTNYDNYGAIEYGSGFAEGRDSVYDSMSYQKISRLVTNTAIAKYDINNSSLVNLVQISDISYNGDNLFLNWSANSDDNGYWYHISISWSNSYIIKSVGFTPNSFSQAILDINGFQSSNVSYNGSYFGWFEVNKIYYGGTNNIEIQFKYNGGAAFEGVNIYVDAFDGFVLDSQNAFNEGYEQGVNAGKAEGYSTGYSEGVNQTTQNVIGWKGLFFSMADLPFKTVSNFLGFEVLGVNLFKAFIGFITVLGILWVFKRLVK